MSSRKRPTTSVQTAFSAAPRVMGAQNSSIRGTREQLRRVTLRKLIEQRTAVQASDLPAVASNT